MDSESPTVTPPPGGGKRPPSAIPGERPGDFIGPYKLLELIGEGGFGEVFLAEQKHPIARRVALKIIKPGMDSKAVIARFEAERQALALMSHPNIAKVLDAGTTALSPVAGEHGSGGRPYFVMELIKGVPITRYCDHNRLTVEQRLKLFAVVCEAVHHAHMKGIIHRDLKPSNILVSIAESGQPRPVVIDFGVAKALAGRLTEQTIHTEQGALIGTPEYMSPEQAEMSEADIDTRADVYALGVILYELLTGTVPFDRNSLRGAGYGAMQKFIREEDPPHPSARFTTLGERRAEIAAARQVRPDELNSQLRRELEWIPLKALRKDRAERYRSAAEMADDVENYLTHHPLIAGPETTRYKVRKFVRRNHAAVAAGSAIAASLVAATGVSVWFGVRESIQKKAALEAADRATAIRDFLIRTLQASDPGKEGRQDILLSDAMLLGVKHLSEGALSNQPQSKAEILRTSAEILSSNGKSETALPLAEEALSILDGLNLGDNPAVVSTLDTLARVTKSLGRPGDAEPMLVRGLEMCRRLYKGDHPAVARDMTDLASVREELGYAVDAEALMVQALDMYRRMFKGDHPDIATGLDKLAYTREALRRSADAEPLYVQSLEMRQRLFKGDHPDVARSLDNLSAVGLDLDKPVEAETLVTRALEMQKRLYKGDHPDIAESLIQLARVRQALGHAPEAESLCIQALDMRRRLYTGDHPDIAGALERLARVRLALSKTPDAVQSFDGSIAMYRRLSPRGSPSLARVLWRSAGARLDAGDAPGALPHAQESVTMAERFLPPEHPNLKDYRDRLARCREALRK